MNDWLERNRVFTQEKNWPNITRKGDPLPDSEEWKDKPDKLQYLER